jgi:hypothetical protein
MGTTRTAAAERRDRLHAGGERPDDRARLEQHREDASCNGCHGVIDPYGLALENFSATGQWRDFDRVAEEPIDATTALPGGVPINGPNELRQALLRRPDQFVQALTQKLMMYALGRELEYYDMPQARRRVARAMLRPSWPGTSTATRPLAGTGTNRAPTPQ